MTSEPGSAAGCPYPRLRGRACDPPSPGPGPKRQPAQEPSCERRLGALGRPQASWIQRSAHSSATSPPGDSGCLTTRLSGGFLATAEPWWETTGGAPGSPSAGRGESMPPFLNSAAVRAQSPPHSAGPALLHQRPLRSRPTAVSGERSPSSPGRTRRPAPSWARFPCLQPGRPQDGPPRGSPPLPEWPPARGCLPPAPPRVGSTPSRATSSCPGRTPGGGRRGRRSSGRGSSPHRPAHSKAPPGTRTVLAVRLHGTKTKPTPSAPPLTSSSKVTFELR